MIAISTAERLKTQKIIDPGMIEAACHFWFTGEAHIRSPFPASMHESLKEEATSKMLGWSERLSPEGLKEINDDILAEKFEELLFETALSKTENEDEKITIRYPFMPRLGDKLRETETAAESIVSGRAIIKEGDDSFLQVVLTRPDETQWETSFELPE